ncbi:hypothetical protein PV11_06349 [Exophiala sideris]|uniref:Heterokaryon incompatibility domain-containing protein n=1 Tax=Exophiala sideris TaxID=1016849 RepID=A0A0D1YV41_9EURO|nr:hypothetical protein PV11_06349 [Exophiala sideris]
MSWAATRRSTRPEDRAYSLLGIFDVFMPLLYGEGERNAFRRLCEEVDKNSKNYRLDDAEKQHMALSGFTEPPASPHVATSKIPEGRVHVTGPRAKFAQPREEIVTGERFTYHPLSDSGFRILVLEAGIFGDNLSGHLYEVSLSEPPPYYALSYCWTQEPATQHVTVNGQSKFIQANLYQALSRIRLRTGPMHIWTDAICINQEDPLERNEQVRQMSTFYSKASSVLVWLGEEDLTSKMALQFVSQIISSGFEWSDSWWLQPGFDALVALLERPWFRRVWVLQEAALAKNTDIILWRSSNPHGPFYPGYGFNSSRTQHHANYFQQGFEYDAFTKSASGDVIHRKMSLETLVDLSTYSERTNQRDTIYALLNLASDVFPLSQSGEAESIIPNYEKDVLDVFVDFISHCCRQSGSLDIICRPWAPISSDAIYLLGSDRRFGCDTRTYPSWIASRKRLPFGDPQARSRPNTRTQANPLVGGSQKRRYNTHDGSKPQVVVGRNKDGTCTGSLYTRGIVLGEIGRLSPRMADAIITKECSRILGTISLRPHSNIIDLPESIWRTLCADRDEKGDPAPRFYRVAMLHLLQISTVPLGPEDAGHDLLDSISSIDTEELLGNETPNHVKTFLTVIRDITWKRRTFRSR